MANIIWLIWSISMDNMIWGKFQFVNIKWSITNESISYGPYDMRISFTLQHSFLAVLFSYKFHCTVDHKYHHSKIRFEHTLKRNLHFFGSSHLVHLVPNVYSWKSRCKKSKKYAPRSLLNTIIEILWYFNLLTRTHHCSTIWMNRHLRFDIFLLRSIL